VKDKSGHEPLKVNRREFFAACAASAVFRSKLHANAPFPVKFRQQPAWAAVVGLIEPGSDEFAGEKLAFEIESGLAEAFRTGRIPVAPNCGGISPFPVRYDAFAPGVSKAVFGHDRNIVQGYRQWRDSLGNVRYARFFYLPGGMVRSTYVA